MTEAEELDLRRELNANPDPRRELEIRRRLQPTVQQEKPPESVIRKTVTDNPFTMGFMDQAAGMAQLLSKVKPKSLDYRTPEMVMRGFKPTDEVIDETIRQYEKDFTDKHGDGVNWARIAGNVASPVSLAGGAAAIPKTVTKRLAAGTALGTTQAATMPVSQENYAEEKAEQMVLGGAMGLAIPGVIETLRGAWHMKKYLTRPFTREGRLKDLTEMYQKMAGDSKDALIEALENAKTYIHGNKPTSGLAIADASRKANKNVGGAFVKLEDDLSRRPTTGDKLKTTADQQASRRSQALSDVIDSSDEGIDKMIKNRREITEPMYDSVKESSQRVNVKGIIAEAEKQLRQSPNQDAVITPMKKILNAVRVQGEGVNFYKNTAREIYSLRAQVKRMMNSKTDDFDVKVLGKIKDEIDKSLDVVPAFKKANDEFQRLSKPINQANTFRDLGKALQNAVEQESPQPFLRAIADAPKTLKKSTGFKRYNKLSDILDEPQIQVVNKVKSELLRNAKAKKMSTQTDKVEGELADSIEPQLPNLLSRPALVANAVLRWIGKDKGPMYEKLATEVAEDPKMLMEILRKPVNNKQRQMLVEMLEIQASMIPARTMALEAGKEK